jgi:hypothetical protein
MHVGTSASGFVLVFLALLQGSPAATACDPFSPFGPPGFFSFLDAPSGVACGDFDLDGIPDLVTANGANTLSTRFGLGAGGVGNGTFGGVVAYSGEIHPVNVIPVDLNNDGRLDLIYTDDQIDDVNVRMGLPGGAFGPINGVFTLSGQPRGLALADFDHDGKVDAAITDASFPRVLILHGEGTGGFGRVGVASAIASPSPILAVADFNKDSHPDVVATCSSSGTIAVLLGVGNGTLAPATTHPAGGTPYDVRTGDFNADGILDVAVSENAAGGMNILFGGGSGGAWNGTFSAPVHHAAGPGAAGMTMGDFDLDGIMDIVVTEPNESSIAVFRGTGSGGLGDGGFAAARHITLHQYPLAMTAADFDEDGTPDLAVACAFSAGVEILIGCAVLTPTATEISIADLEIEPGRVRLSWYGATLAGGPVRIHRQLEGHAWEVVGAVPPDGSHRVTFEDLAVQAGAHYRYRIGIGAPGAEELAGEIAVNVPFGSLAFASIGPNPATTGVLDVAFSLGGEAPATLTLVDVGGRAVATNSIAGGSVGRRTLRFGERARLAPGVYLVRLTQAGRTLSRKAIVLR